MTTPTSADTDSVVQVDQSVVMGYEKDQISIAELPLEDLLELRAVLGDLIGREYEEQKKLLHAKMLEIAQSSGFNSLDEFVASQNDKLAVAVDGVMLPPKIVTQRIEFHRQTESPQSGVLTNDTYMSYWNDLRRYVDWGGTVPSAPETVAAYLMTHAGTHKYATLVRWRVSIGKAHTSQGFDNPSKSDAVHAALMAIRSSYGKEQRKVAPLIKEQVLAIADTLGDSLRDKRDKALILSGFAVGLRRSEITSLNISDLHNTRKGIEIRLPDGNVVLRHASGLVCPVRAVKEWLIAARIKEGPVFQGINRHGQQSGSRLTGHGIALIVKERVQAIGVDPSEYSGLSLRAGLMASAEAAGILFHKVNMADGIGIL